MENKKNMQMADNAVDMCSQDSSEGNGFADKALIFLAETLRLFISHTWQIVAIIVFAALLTSCFAIPLIAHDLPRGTSRESLSGDMDANFSWSDATRLYAYDNGYDMNCFEKFNSPAEENGLYGAKVYIHGTFENITKTGIIPSAMVSDEDGNVWAVKSMDGDIRGRLSEGVPIVVFGRFEGYSNTLGAPVLYCEYVNLHGEWIVYSPDNPNHYINLLFEKDRDLFANTEEPPATTTTTAATTTTTTTTTTATPTVTYYSGNYKIGVDMPAGTYVAYATSGFGGYMCISKDSNQKNIIKNDIFDEQIYLTVSDGQYLELSSCHAVSAESAPPAEPDGFGCLSEGLYKVGFDLPAGEYKAVATSDSGGYLAIYDAPLGVGKIVSNDIFDNSRYVTVRKGQYLYLSRAEVQITE